MTDLDPNDGLGRDGPLAQMLQDMTPLDRGILLQSGPPGIIPALMAELKLSYELPQPAVKQTAQIQGTDR
jgi:hypothetical protein